jgi:beta-glucosidase
MPGGGERAVYSEDAPAIYEMDYPSKEKAYEHGYDLNTLISEEGFVLLKNKNNALPISKEKARVSVFGKNSVNIIYGGSGSGGASTKDAIDLYQSLKDAGFVTNPKLKAFYESKDSGKERPGNPTNLDNGNSISMPTAETPQSNYTNEVKNSYNDYKDVALIVFSRIGGEGFDLPRNMRQIDGARNETDHYLQLDQNETDLIQSVCEVGFEKVVVIINSAAALELGFLTNPLYYAYNSKIDAAINIGFPGISGMKALGRILNGEVNPSGRTVDTYAYDFKANPTFVNFGDNNENAGDLYTVDHLPSNQKRSFYFVDYEESIYMGYRYYETRGATDGEEWYQNNVVYPFGYGLSYTTFNWEVVDKTQIENVAISALNDYTVKVKVTNTGTVAGKDVVELYGHAPYETGKIEKSDRVLLDYAKTALLQPGAFEIVELNFNPYYLASYDYNDANGNSFKGYELDSSNNYFLYVSKNAHEVVASIPFKVTTNIRFENDPTTDYPVVNLYKDNDNPYLDSDIELETLLSRGDWTNTWPVAPTNEERKLSGDLYSALANTEHNNPNVDDYYEMEYPLFDEEVIYTLRDLLSDEDGALQSFVNYDDERWEDVLNSANMSEMIHLYNFGAFKTDKLSNINKPKTNDTDGPAGFVNFMDGTTFYGTVAYCSETVLASTFSKELAEEYGKSIGNEGLWGNAKGDKMPYSGWYAPGVNLHRSPFGGRNFEYYSEDGFLNGSMSANVIKGAQSKGVYCFIKHFALNEQDTHRSLSGNSSWVTEQAIREIYLKPFELAVKEGGTRALMTAFNRIGTKWVGGDYRLLTEILRNEWGFRGSVICDFNTVPSYMNGKQMAYAGGDINLATMASSSWNVDTSDQADIIVLRNAIKNVLYTVVNSNAMNGEIIGYRMPLWTVGLIIIDVAAVVALGTWGTLAILSLRKKKELE